MTGIKTGFCFAVVLPLSITPVQAEQKQIGGKTIFEERCGGFCHQLPEPDMLNQQQWQRVLSTMRKRMQQKNLPPLTKHEFKVLLDYLDSRLKK